MPSSDLIRELKAAGCSERSCWTHESFEDGGVRVRLGNGWWCFMADQHFSNTNHCLGASETRQGFCDAIGAFSQGSNREVRVVEAKTPVDFSEAKDSLRYGVEFALRLPSVSRERIRVELHVRGAPRTTARPRKERRTLKVGNHVYEIALYVDGSRQM